MGKRLAIPAILLGAALLAGCSDGVAGEPEAAETGPADSGEDVEPDIGAGPGSDVDPDDELEPRGDTSDESVAVHEGAVDVTIELPDGWQAAEEAAVDDATGIINPEACADQFCDNVNVLLDPAFGMSLPEYHELSMDQIDEYSIELLTEDEIEVDGHDGYELEYVGDLGFGHGDLHYLQQYTVVDDHGVIVTFTARPDSFDDWLDDAEHVLESIDID